MNYTALLKSAAKFLLYLFVDVAIYFKKNQAEKDRAKDYMKGEKEIEEKTDKIKLNIPNDWDGIKRVSKTSKNRML